MSLMDLPTVRWPVRPLVGGGDLPVMTEVPAPGLAWTRRHPVPVPLGAGAADRIRTVARLRWLHEYVALPLCVLLVPLALGFLVWSWSGTAHPGRDGYGSCLVAIFVLGMLGYVPSVVAIATKTPRIASGELRLPAAHEDVAREAVALNPAGTVRIHSK